METRQRPCPSRLRPLTPVFSIGYARFPDFPVCLGHHPGNHSPNGYPHGLCGEVPGQSAGQLRVQFRRELPGESLGDHCLGLPELSWGQPGREPCGVPGGQIPGGGSGESGRVLRAGFRRRFGCRCPAQARRGLSDAPVRSAGALTEETSEVSSARVRPVVPAPALCRVCEPAPASASVGRAEVKGHLPCGSAEHGL